VTAPWWTAADDAEFHVLIEELVDGIHLHRERCSICCQGDAWCRPLQEALEEVVHWRGRRLSHSYAIAMRAKQDLADLENRRAA
jgi:hypothetical protein